MKAFWYYVSLWRRTMGTTPSQQPVALALLHFPSSWMWKVEPATDLCLYIFNCFCQASLNVWECSRKKYTILTVCDSLFFSLHGIDVPAVLSACAAATDGGDGGASPHSFHLDLPGRGEAGVGDAAGCPWANAGGQQWPVCHHHHCGAGHRNAHRLVHVLLQQKWHGG